MNRPFVKVVYPPSDGSGRARIGKGTKVFAVIDGVQYPIPGIKNLIVTNPAGDLCVLTLEIVDFEVEQPRKEPTVEVINHDSRVCPELDIP